MRLALAQLNTTIGDLRGNAARIRDSYQRAAAAGATLLLTPELALTGYPPRDLVEKPIFLERAEQELKRFASEIADLPITAICGTVERAPKLTACVYLLLTSTPEVASLVQTAYDQPEVETLMLKLSSRR